MQAELFCLLDKRANAQMMQVYPVWERKGEMHGETMQRQKFGLKLKKIDEHETDEWCRRQKIATYLVNKEMFQSMLDVTDQQSRYEL